MKIHITFPILLLLLPMGDLLAAALKCGTPFTSECLGATDKRYDPEYSNALADQSDVWSKGMFTGMSMGRVTSYAYDDDATASKASRVPYNITTGTFGFPGEFINLVGVYDFWSATITGSRYHKRGVVVTAPVCEDGGGPPPGVVVGDEGEPPADDPFFNSTSSGNDCTLKPGKAIPYNLWGTSTHEKNGRLRLFMGSGYYAALKETFFIPQDDSTLYMMSRNRVSGTGPVTVQSSGDHIAYDEGKKKIAATSIYNFEKPGNPLTIHSISISAGTPDKKKYVETLQEAYNEYNIPLEERISFEDENASEFAGAWCVDPDQCATNEDFCTVGMDPECSVSPYQEPAASLNAGGVVFVVLCCVAFVLSAAFLVFRKLSQDQKQRYKANFVRGIAMNINIAPTAGMIEAEQLKKEFDFMDKDGGGTISKTELKAWLDTGKAGKLSDKDFDAMFCALDVDKSGEVDFVEFITFLGSCGAQFDEVDEEMKKMTKDEKFGRSSRRLSTIEMRQSPSADLES